MNPPQPSTPTLDLPAYLFARREAVLNIWRTTCTNDPALQAAMSLSQEEFNDQIPTILNLFNQQLRGEPLAFNLITVASEHGLNRWHKGYPLSSLLAELNHFNQCLTAELSGY